jgi:glucose/arabinose dehydrogenase
VVLRAARPAIAAKPASIRLVAVGGGLTDPLFATHAGDGSGRLFILERPGRIRVLAGGTVAPRAFLDITDRALAGPDRGLLGLAFHPRYRINGRFFVHYTRQPDGATVVSEFRASTNPNLALRSERVRLVVEKPFSGHHGGMLAFGSDDLLYIGLGDGGAADQAQNPRSLLGKILRVDVDRGGRYAIPPDNPFTTGGGRGEIFALGFRNPWRFSFDRRTGRLYAGDVGQDRFEEIDLVTRGGNYGWQTMEGAGCHLPVTGCSRAGFAPPIATYRHAAGRCSIIGGYVYRGRDIPALEGTYVYADFCTGELFGLREGRSTVLLDSGLLITSFGEDQRGELVVTDLDGTIRRIVGPAASSDRLGVPP